MATKKAAPKNQKRSTPAAQQKKQTSSYKSDYELRQKSKRQMAAVLLFAVGILLLFIELIPGSGLWKGFRGVLYGLFGLTALLIPVVLIYIAVMATMDKPIGAIRNKLWQAGVLASLICGLFEVCKATPFTGEGFVGILSQLYTSGMERYSGGGVCSLLLGWPVLYFCGGNRAGAIIILVLCLFVFLMLLTGTTLLSFFKTVGKPVKKIEESYAQRREAQEHKNQGKFNIDVDLGPEPPMPEHPVSSPKPSVEELLELERRQSEETAKRMAEARKIIGNAKAEASVESEENPTDALVAKAMDQQENYKYIGVDEEQEEEEEKPGSQLQFYTDENNVVTSYQTPPISLLRLPKTGANRDISDELKRNADLLVETLKSFGVQTRIIDISRGPTVTRYELQPSAGVKISKITGLADDIALNLATAGVRIEAPIPNKAAVGIEVPNKATDVVTLREILETREFHREQSKVSVALGKDIAGNSVIADISTMPHLLIAGATGSGKSVCINSIIMSLLYKASPSEVRLLMIDPKVVELGIYNGIPHLLVPVVTDPRKASGALAWAVTEMLNRYKLFAEHNVRDITGYNQLAEKAEDVNPMPQIVLIIDELADLMMAAPKEVEDSICRLAQMARAAGMHLIIATQRPSVDVITGVIKANIPSRIAFAVSSQVDSRTILDSSGAEKLIGRGDMLFSPVGMTKPLRVQGCYVSDDEIDQVVRFVKNKETAVYDDQVMEEIEKQAAAEKTEDKRAEAGDEQDELLPAAVEFVIEAGQASTSYLQRRLKVGYARAARLIDEMEQKGFVGPFEGSKPRQVLISKQQWLEMKMNQEET